MCECKTGNPIKHCFLEKINTMDAQSVIIEMFTKIEFYEVYLYFGIYISWHFFKIQSL